MREGTSDTRITQKPQSLLCDILVTECYSVMVCNALYCATARAGILATGCVRYTG